MLSELHGLVSYCLDLSVLSFGHFDLESLDLIITKTMNRFADAPSIVVTHSRQLMKASFWLVLHTVCVWFQFFIFINSVFFWCLFVHLHFRCAMSKFYSVETLWGTFISHFWIWGTFSTISRSFLQHSLILRFSYQAVLILELFTKDLEWAQIHCTVWAKS